VWVDLQGEKGRLCLGSAVERPLVATSSFCMNGLRKQSSGLEGPTFLGLYRWSLAENHDY